MTTNNKTLENALWDLYTNYFCYMYPCYETENSIWHVAEGCSFDEDGNVISLGRIVASGPTWEAAYKKALEVLSDGG